MVSGKSDMIDKSGWAEGPWDDEPDWAYGVADNGLNYAIRRNGVGALAGYVGLPEKHDLYGKEPERQGARVLVGDDDGGTRQRATLLVDHTAPKLGATDLRERCSCGHAHEHDDRGNREELTHDTSHGERTNDDGLT